MAHDVTVEILLTGEGMSPGKIRSKEIAEVIESVEDMIASVVVRNHPELKKETIVVGLKGIRPGSIGLEFSPNLAELTLPATRRITKAIAENDFGILPSSAINSLRKLSHFTRRHQCNAEFFTQNGRLEALAVLTPETQIPDIYPLSGETSIYGEITRVGGAEPKIQFKTLEGQIIYCSTSKVIAKKAGAKLYTKVELHGLAEWNSETFEIENFHVIDISDYEETSPSKAFEELANLIGDSFDNVDDVDRFVSEIRYGL
ncbi:MAG: hypothetical protein HC840_27035 [Leptolyngbyaceae cyanobacterium RM2_2_4]|nr:hypothetical protein [Leptolyngbyaceae cyanobacterium SM1_4_3]NJO52448.1 hypothetical protein [Leptolyngbyaceae cyanobacterium RM2_2_4]